MLVTLKMLLRTLVLPPSGPLLVAFLGAWLLGTQASRFRRRAGVALLAGALGTLWLLSTPPVADALWRGIGMLPLSGLVIKNKFREFDAAARFGIPADSAAFEMPGNCSCGDVLRGRVRPDRCPLFSTSCTPENPVGPCMVSSEGSCAAYFKYGA